MSRKKHPQERLLRYQKSQQAKKRLDTKFADSLATNNPMHAMTAVPANQVDNVARFFSKSEFQKKIFELIGQKVMLSCSLKHREGNATYATVRAKDESTSARMKYEIERAVSHITAIPISQQTTEILMEAGNIIEELQGNFLKAGFMVEEPVNFYRGIPNAIRIGDDSLRIMNKVTEMDYLFMTEMFKSEVAKVEKNKASYLRRTIERLEKEVSCLSEQIAMQQ